MDLLDQVLDNTSQARVVSEQHDTSQVNYGGDAAVTAAARGRPSEPWDEREYGLSLVQAQAKWDAAQTPEAKAKVIEELKARALQRASLDTTGGRVRMMAAGKLPWHGLGVLVDKAVSSQQAMQLAGMDWPVHKLPLFYKWPNSKDPSGRTEELKSQEDVYAIVRGDTYQMLGSVGPLYKPFQNAESFAFLDGVLSQFGARYETAGSIYDGRKIWLLANLPNQRFSVNGTDEVEPYVLFTNSHDGTSAARCFPTSVRVECANTFRNAASSGNGKGLSIRHTGDLQAKVRSAQEALGIAIQGFDDFKGIAGVMARTKTESFPMYANDVLDATLTITQAEADLGADVLARSMAKTQAQMDLLEKQYTKQIEHRTAVLEDIIERYENKRNGVNGMRGTVWAAFNAVTEHADHSSLRRYKGSEHNRNSRRFENLLYGEADEMKQVAYEKALALVK